MPTAHPPRSAATRAAATAALLLALTGCSLFDRDSGSGTDGADRGASAPSASPSGSVSASTVEETCARVLETARTAPERLREDLPGLLEEVEDLAATAPPELAGQITAVRDAVEEFRQGDRSLVSVVREARSLQERCSG